MIVFSEEKSGPQSIFIKRILNNQREVVSCREVRFPMFQINRDDFKIFVLYDDHMKVVSDFYEYINYDLKDSPLNTRSKAAFSLRLLYCFLSLSGYTIDKIDEIAFKEMLYFLRGINSNPKQYAIKTQRNANTVNGYLSVFRNFLTSRSINSPPFFKSHLIKADSYTSNDFTSTTERKKYDNNLRSSKQASNTIPKYISPDDFRLLYNLLIKNNDVQASLLMHLMYGYGLRLGEVLGLTLEDLQEVKVKTQLMPVLILRNRLSDQKYQNSKGLPHIIDRKQYLSKDYQATSVKISITYYIYEKLVEYVNSAHSIASEKHPANYSRGAADIVSVTNIPEYNHYIFLNRYGNTLSDQTWNNSLKKYFKDANIQLDFDVRSNNLSHRFRHGFAMFHARFSEHPADLLSLQKMMRHKSISSTMVYFNPTPEEEYKIKMEFQTELYNLIPELKEGLNATVKI